MSLFYENGRFVRAVWPEDSDLDTRRLYQKLGTLQDASEAMIMGICLILDGHNDGAAARAAALAVMLGLYPSAADAARSIHVDKSTVSRQIELMRNRMREDFNRKNGDKSTP